MILVVGLHSQCNGGSNGTASSSNNSPWSVVHSSSSIGIGLISCRCRSRCWRRRSSLRGLDSSSGRGHRGRTAHVIVKGSYWCVNGWCVCEKWNEKHATIIKKLTGLMQWRSRSIALEFKHTRVGPCVRFALTNTHPVLAAFEIIQWVNLSSWQ